MTVNRELMLSVEPARRRTAPEAAGAETAGPNRAARGAAGWEHTTLPCVALRVTGRHRRRAVERGDGRLLAAIRGDTARLCSQPDIRLPRCRYEYRNADSIFTCRVADMWYDTGRVVACPSGLRERIANPFFMGSNPIATFPPFCRAVRA